MCVCVCVCVCRNLIQNIILYWKPVSCQVRCPAKQKLIQPIAWEIGTGQRNQPTCDSDQSDSQWSPSGVLELGRPLKAILTWAPGTWSLYSALVSHQMSAASGRRCDFRWGNFLLEGNPLKGLAATGWIIASLCSCGISPSFLKGNQGSTSQPPTYSCLLKLLPVADQFLLNCLHLMFHTHLNMSAYR